MRKRTDNEKRVVTAIEQLLDFKGEVMGPWEKQDWQNKLRVYKNAERELPYISSLKELADMPLKALKQRDTPTTDEALAMFRDEAAVDKLAYAMKARLREARANRKEGWQICQKEILEQGMIDNLRQLCSTNPEDRLTATVDIANFAAFYYSRKGI